MNGRGSQKNILGWRHSWWGHEELASPWRQIPKKWKTKLKQEKEKGKERRKEDIKAESTKKGGSSWHCLTTIREVCDLRGTCADDEVFCCFLQRRWFGGRPSATQARSATKDGMRSALMSSFDVGPSTKKHAIDKLYVVYGFDQKAFAICYMYKSQYFFCSAESWQRTTRVSLSHNKTKALKSISRGFQWAHRSMPIYAICAASLFDIS